MNSQILSLMLVFIGPAIGAFADEPLVLKTDKTSATDGYWNTDEGYFVGCHYGTALEKVDDADPGFVSVRLGLVHGGRLHRGPFAVGAKDLQVIGPMWLVIREGDTVILRVPTTAEVDLGNHVHLLAKFNARADLVPKMEIEFEERHETGSRRIRVPLKSFMKN
jgi:hypothetical protein